METLVVKLGSSLIADERGELRIDVMRHVCLEVARARSRGCAIVLVTSGAVARGMGRLGLSSRPTGVAELQAASAIGQGELFHAFSRLLGEHAIPAAQVLLTQFDLATRRHYMNASQTLTRLLGWGAVPVINENDTTASDEITFGDNDFLAAQVAVLLAADMLVLLTEVDGVYTADPRADSGVMLIPEVRDFAALGREAEITSSTSPLGSGGMRSKVVAAEIAATAAIPTVVANGRRAEVVARALAGQPAGTRFEPRPGPRPSSFRLWLEHAKPARGSLAIEARAANALNGGGALLAAEIADVVGDFHAGDGVNLVAAGSGGAPIGKGIVNFSAAELRRIKGLDAAAVAALLPGASPEVIHRDQLALSAQRQKDLDHDAQNL